MEDNNTLLKVKNSPFVRDSISKAILNTNDKERELYLARKTAMRSKDKRIELLEQKVLKLEELIEKLIQK